jgi:DNA-binding transcriptional ArsR family regulator
MTSNIVSDRVYLAIIGDVVRSRDLHERGVVQARLREGIAQVNERFVSTIVSKFILTIGDEFQGLLGNTEDIVHLLAVLRTAIHPIEQRIGIGVGTLDTPLEEVALGMDGPCFHRARSAIECAKEDGTSIEVETSGRNEPFRIYSLLYAGLRRGWTTRQREVFDLSLGGNSGKEIAHKLGVSPSAISQHLSAAESDVILDATEIWLNALKTAYLKAE